jgi:radical SAM protein with 4Fe4S-binding SPASM domain
MMLRKMLSDLRGRRVATKQATESAPIHAQSDAATQMMPIGDWVNAEIAGKYLRHGQHPRPLMVICETVNLCNDLCIICAYKDQTRKKTMMPSHIFSEFLRQYSEIGGGFLSLTPMVGEVLLDRLLIERLREIREHPDITHLSVTTNAVMARNYDDAALGEIVNSFDRIQVSVYGMDDEEYSAMTQRDTYQQMREGIKRIGRLFRGEFVLGFRLLKHRDSSDIDAWINELTSEADSDIHIAGYGFVNSFANWGLYDVSKPLPFDAKWITPNPAKSQCLIPLVALQVFSNGNVSFCPCDDFDNVPELHLGNILETHLRDMYSSEKVAHLWDWARYGVPSFCKTCSFHIPLSAINDQPGLFERPDHFIGA